jgi:hypothetical protein
MFGFVVARNRYDRQVMRREFGWVRNDPRGAALADFTCAIRCPVPEAEKTGIGPCPPPALLYVAGPGTTIRSAARLTHLHVDHPQLSGFWLGVKESCSRFAMKRRTMPTMSGLGSCSCQPAYRKKPADRAVGTASQK